MVDAQTEALQHVIERLEHLQEALAQQQEIIAQQQAEIAALRAERLVASGERPALSRTSGARVGRSGRGTSRRRLLAGAGAAAAAATVALVASEGQRAYAAPAPDGSSLILGSGATNTASTTTTLSVASGSPSPLLTVDVSGNTTPGAVAIQGVSHASNGYCVVADGGTSGNGIKATTTNGYAVYASSTTSNCVFGYSSGSGRGIIGISNSNYGVYGSSTSNNGVYASSSMNADLYAAGGRIWLNLQSFAGAPTGSGTTYNVGEIIRDSAGELWLCVQGGAPGQWVRASHAVNGYTGGATSYLSKPIRLLDTRSGATDALTNGGGPYTVGGSPYPLTIAGVSFMSVTVPASCAGAIGNVTVVATASGGGYLALVPHGAGFSGTANLAYDANQIVSNAFNVGLSVDGKLDIIIGGNPTDVVLDLFAVVA